METERTVAYFSMEIGLDLGMPTYSGGLGVLAGDTIRAAADLNIPLVAVTLLSPSGFSKEHFDVSWYNPDRTRGDFLWV